MGFSGILESLNWGNKVATKAYEVLQSRAHSSRTRRRTFISIMANLRSKHLQGPYLDRGVSSVDVICIFIHLKAERSFCRWKIPIFFSSSISGQRSGLNSEGSVPQTAASVCSMLTGMMMTVPRGITIFGSVVPGSGLKRGTALSFAD